MDNMNWYENPDQRQYGTQEKKRTGARVGIGTLIVCMLFTAVVGGAAGGYLARGIAPQSVQPSPASIETPVASAAVAMDPAQTPEAPVATLAAGTPYTTAQIVEKSAPSIVGIDVQSSSGSRWYGGDPVTTGSGSGIIISEDGYIITNHHVVQNAEAVKVYLHDDTEYEATLVGTDESTDLAVIKIEAAGLIAAEFGNSSDLVVGEEVVAIGNPLGELRGTATNGIVSALSRSISFSDGTTRTLLQTNAAINPGNSGGGLFDSQGKLIGIVNAKVASGSTEGLGFAIPVDAAKSVVADLIDSGYVTGRAYLGVYLQNIALQGDGADGRNGGGLDNIFGFGGNGQQYETRVQVTNIVVDSAAAKAGIQAGDLIVKIGDQEITSTGELSSAIAAYKAGDVAKLVIERNGVQSELSVTFGEYIPD